MAVSLNAKMAAGNSADGLNQEVSANTTISSTGLTIAGGATLLVAGMSVARASNSSPVFTGMTWGGVALTAGPTVHTGGGPSSDAAIYYLINPATGTGPLVGNWTNSSDCYMSAAAFNGTDVATGINVSDSVTATGTGTLAVNSAANDATVAFFAVDGNTPTVAFTKIYAEAALAPGGGADYALGGSPTNTHIFTSGTGTARTVVGVHILAASGSGSAGLSGSAGTGGTGAGVPNFQIPL